MDGDVYDPSGTLTGGSKPTTGSILKRLHDLKLLQDEMTELNKTHGLITGELKNVEKVLAAKKQLEQDLEMAIHETKLMEQQLDSNTQTQIIRKVSDLNGQLEQLNTAIREAKSREDGAKAECKRIENEIKEFSANKDSKLDSLKVSRGFICFGGAKRLLFCIYLEIDCKAEAGCACDAKNCPGIAD